MEVRLSALRAGRPLLPGRILVRISIRGWIDTSVIVRLEGLGQPKNPMNSSGIEPTTFRLVSIVLQPTTPQRVPCPSITTHNMYEGTSIIKSKLRYTEMHINAMHFSHLSTSFCIPLAKESCCCRSQKCTVFLTSSSLWNLRPRNASLSVPNTW
jgi:hypothetical protein